MIISVTKKSNQRNEINVRLSQPRKDCLDDYYTVKAKGCRPHLMDGEHCRHASRADLEEECFNLDTYSRIRHEIIEQCGFDDWEWD